MKSARSPAAPTPPARALAAPVPRASLATERAAGSGRRLHALRPGGRHARRRRAFEDSSASGIDEPGTGADDDTADSGAAFVYERAAGVWTLAAYLKASDPWPGAEFGYQVAVSGDTFAVSARWASAPLSGIGAVYVFPQRWQLVAAGLPQARAPGRRRRLRYRYRDASDEILINPPTAINGGSDGSGAGYLFSRSGATWSIDMKIKPPAGLDMPALRSVSVDATSYYKLGAPSAPSPAAPGAPLGGAVYIYH